MIKRFKNDNNGLDDERAQKEVDKFMMDAEMVNTLIVYEQKKSRGELEPEETNQIDFFQLFISGYLVYVVGSIIKRQIDRQTTTGALLDGVDGDAIQGAVDAVQTSTDVIQTSLDVVQSSM